LKGTLGARGAETPTNRVLISDILTVHCAFAANFTDVHFYSLFLYSGRYQITAFAPTMRPGAQSLSILNNEKVQAGDANKRPMESGASSSISLLRQIDKEFRWPVAKQISLIDRIR
jgi:hypothetical protein